METYEQLLEVKEDDLDDLNHVNNVRYVQWIQDISKAHWLGAANKDMLENTIWVVQNHNITYKNAAILGDRIRIKTHISETKGATSIRVVEMYHAGTGKLLVHSKTAWCLLNSHTLKPMRISDEISTIFKQRNSP